MKKNICAIIFYFLSTGMMLAHGEGVHQHMVREAYKLLKYYIGQDIREMKDHVGYNEEGNGQFNPGNLIVIGAYQEDHSDATNEGYGFGGWFVTNTHFWDPDQGDNSTFNYAGNAYSNSYQKARKYIYGGYELRVPYPANAIIEAYSAPSNLFQFYKDGRIFYRGYYNWVGQFITRNRWLTASIEFRNKIVWEILGRICHLIGDMTVPAHVHNDPHPPTDLDTYENWMNQPSIYNQWTYQNAITQGGLIDPTVSSNPMKYLFYPPAQISSFFNTFDVDGNNGSGVNDPFSLYPGLNEKIIELTNFYGGTAPTKDYAVALDYCANQTFVLGIRSMAGLLYWFVKETNLLPQPLSGVSVMGDFSLYLGSTGNWYTTLINGLEPFTYNWQIMYLGNISSLSSDDKSSTNTDKIGSGGIIINAPPSNYWFSVGTSPTFSRVNNGSDPRDFKLRCIVTDGSNTTKTSNEFYVDMLSEYPPQQNIVQNNSIEQRAFLAKESVVASIPLEYSLKQNYPNPFNPVTKIAYSLPEVSHVTLVVYDMLGREVKILVNENKPSGNYEIDFNALGLTSGTYIYRMIAGNYQSTKKLIVIK